MAKSSPSLKLRRIVCLSPAVVLLYAVAVSWVFSGVAAQAQAARFDLSGPKIEVRVTRAGKSLPIAYVPNLQSGDKLWLHPDLPPSQSVHYLLIVAFLRGTTNPPPENWFFRIETWNRKALEEGAEVTVPDEAEQAILFLAPETGGDFATLKKAVRGRPGIFVRASQDLSEASFEQTRIEKYVASMRQVPPSDPKALLEHSTLLARTLNLKPNEECFTRPVDMQYNCLTQSGNQTLLDDGHAQSVISALTNGSSSDFINAASYTSLGGSGVYSAYVGAVVDLFRILGGLHSAQFQYIPAISFPENESLNLRLNTPPSFRNPKSVIVIGLPSIQKAVPPPLRPADPNLVSCLLKPRVVLPLEGAPLVFSTSYAHDIVLHVNTPTPTDIPLVPDAYQGGLVVNQTPDRKPLPLTPTTEAAKPQAAAPATAPTATTPTATPSAQPAPPTVTGTITGSWGFDTFTGPTLRLQNQPSSNWRLAADDALIAGRENHVLLASSGSACVQSIRLESAPGTFTDTKWKAAEHANIVDVTLPLKASDPGSLQIAIQQFGSDAPAVVTAKTFSEPATLAGLELHAGDTFALATGTNLAQVQQLTVNNLTFKPAQPDSESPATSPGTLRLSLPPATAAPSLKVGEKLSASVTLRDGRTLVLPVTVTPARPAVTLLSRNMGHPDTALHLTSPDDLPANQQLTFSLKSSAPFPRNGKIEIANADESLYTDLTVTAGTLVIENPNTVVGTLDPLKTFGTSAFGPLRLRAVSPGGIAGDWLPLVTLVRLPTITNLRCTSDPAAPCTLTGTNLYLLDSISADPDFAQPTAVPEGFVSTTISVPRPTTLPTNLSATRPATTTLYLRLRDDPSPTNSTVVPALPLPASAAAPTSATLPIPAVTSPN
jgi:hypothetical protein